MIFLPFYEEIRCNLNNFENFEKVENLKVNRTGHISKSTLKLWNSISEQSNEKIVYFLKTIVKNNLWKI